MKVSLSRVSAEGGPTGLPSRRNTRLVLGFQEGAGTLSDSYDRDKAVSSKDAGNGIFGENRSLSLLPVENIKVKTKLLACLSCTFVDNRAVAFLTLPI